MAVLIPSIGSCTFDSGGERRLAERLEQKLEGDYLCWYNVALGPAALHPDFIVFHPRRGLLILEVKDWRARTILAADRGQFTIHTDRGPLGVENPLEQARHYAHAAVDVLQRDPQLVFSSGREAGKLAFPWSYGVVLPNFTRRQFEDGGLGEVIPPHRVICQDEMLETVEPEAFQQRLWDMFPVRFKGALSLPQIDRVRWHLFPEVRIPARQAELFADAAPMDLLQVMDLQQEQLARSLGEGHRVIHGVAGSGKTLILGYRAEHLAQGATKPVLILCYNESLARRIDATMRAKGLRQKVHTHHFHQWCRAQLVAYHAGLPESNDDLQAYFAEMVERVIRAVDRGQIPAAQYDAILIDEGHDFRPEWFKLVVQMVDPKTNSLLVLYDDAQSIYGDEKRKKFSFKSVGIQAAGRTTILKINYRNTDAILRFARDVAQSILEPSEADDDGVPLLMPQSAGRAGMEPQIINLPTQKAEAEFVIQRMKDAHRSGIPWRDMAVIYREYERDAKLIRKLLPAHGVPLIYFRDATYANTEDKVTLITMHSCKGLEFPLVVIPGADKLKGTGELAPQEAKLLYVAMTRATKELVLCGVGE
ncbi:DNA helicase II [Denitratisoma sp. DHT3]|uniref:DEAD/DEAH box helicase n=1 Tax=Denitratisoma sp. DHT3 TaxID=1981880 RepID=UPI001198B31A|nr:3'-5' exonuclease [Denitratisoma sp. DHT3]QDX80689.1 DNA helicase II [Denitratisoma sp. DHT3]